MKSKRRIDKVLNGMLQEQMHKFRRIHLLPGLLRFVASVSRWANADTQLCKGKGASKKTDRPSGGRRNNTPGRRLKEKLIPSKGDRKRWPNRYSHAWHASHIESNAVKLDRQKYYARTSNLILLPNALVSLSDYLPEVTAMLLMRSEDIYNGTHPDPACLKKLGLTRENWEYMWKGTVCDLAGTKAKRPTS
ncbi:MAG: hypothetical protein HY360_19250 [Verrucomicrobia bacterium]|nr:hypothetical protein [Verrucomicrobiota bacterium]